MGWSSMKLQILMKAHFTWILHIWIITGNKIIKTTGWGKEKVRMSVVMTATAVGDKLPVKCVIPRKFFF